MTHHSTKHETYYGLGKAAWDKLTFAEQLEVQREYRLRINTRGLEADHRLLVGVPGEMLQAYRAL